MVQKNRASVVAGAIGALCCAAGAVAAVDAPVYRVRGSAIVQLAEASPLVGVFLASDPGARSIEVPFEGAIDLRRSASGAYVIEQAKLGRSPMSLIVASDESSATLGQVQFTFWGDGGDGLNIGDDGVTRVFDLPGELISTQLDPGGVMRVSAGITLSADAATMLGVPQAAGAFLGEIAFTVEDRFDSRDEAANFAELDLGDGGSAGSGVERICTPATVGPDVIVGDLSDTANYGVVGGIRAYAIGTTSCNAGDALLQWQASVNRHPVIGQHLYRIKNGRIEQIGISFLKHGFTALSGNLCCPCSSGGGGSTLGLGCSDPYGAGLNGSQSNIGPRWEINTSTGWYPYPWTAPTAAATIGRRLQVLEADVNPALHPGAIYLIEGQYVAPDESSFGSLMNDNNNASYRRVTVGSTPFSLTMAAPTVRQKPAIQGWADLDSNVGISIIDSAPGGVHDGRFIVGYKVTQPTPGVWHYEFAVHNLNSGRLGKSFSIPLPPNATVSNAGFKDVFHHSGDGVGDVTQDGTDWAITIDANQIAWSTVDCVQNANANALHWGTLYNFWFDCDKPPAKLSASLGLFRGNGPYSAQPGGTPCGTGEPGTLVLSANVPAADCNGNGVADVTDIATGTSQDLNMNGVPDECEVPPACPGDADGDGSVGLSDIAMVIINWFTQGSPGTLGDLDSDGDRDLEDISVVSVNWATICP